MKVIKTIQFQGVFCKADEEDNEPLDNIQGEIYCYASGLVLFEPTEDAKSWIGEKHFLESIPLHLHNNPFGEIIRPGYQGKYKIYGHDLNGTSLEAFYLPDTRHKPKLILRNLKINYDKMHKCSDIFQIKYGLTRLNLFENFSTFIQNKESKFSIKYLSKETEGGLDSELTCEMIIENLASEKQYNCYSSWISFLLSFTLGAKTEIIYKIATRGNSKNATIETELWFGGFVRQRTSVLKTMQDCDVKKFFQQVSPQINYDIFAEKALGLGLGLSLFWYLETCETNLISTKFILLCTAIEVLIEGFKQKNTTSSKLISTPLYRTVRKKIFKIIENNKPQEFSEIESKNYEIFSHKIEQSFSSGSFNQIGNLSANLEDLLNQYKVQYDDLFPNLDFIKIRNNFIHRGTSDFNSAYPSYMKLQSLYIRIILSMLNYQGGYIENNETGKLIYTITPYNSF